ncbi:MAG: response regulator transcription factor [Gaiellales bacterium]
MTPAGTLEESATVTKLSPDEQKLLMLLTVGLKDQVIARQLGIAGRTVERHVAKLMRRLNAKSRFQAGVEAARSGWIPPVG